MAAVIVDVVFVAAETTTAASAAAATEVVSGVAAVAVSLYSAGLKVVVFVVEVPLSVELETIWRRPEADAVVIVAVGVVRAVVAGAVEDAVAVAVGVVGAAVEWGGWLLQSP